MAYNSTYNSPFEYASKLGHLNVVESEWVKSLVKDFESNYYEFSENEKDGWEQAELEGISKLKHFWAVDGSNVTVSSNTTPSREVSFVKAGLLSIEQSKLNRIDKKQPHPILLKDLLAKSAVHHSTVFPLRNIKTSMGSNFNSIRNIVRDSLKLDQEGIFYETLKWLVYEKWREEYVQSPDFQCPHCENEVSGLEPNEDTKSCESCQKEVYLTDMIGFHLDITEESAPESVSSAYMLVVEHIMLFTTIRLLWNHKDKNLVSETLFIKDGPLTLRSQYSKLVPSIRNFLEYAKLVERPIHIIGQEKSGVFADHLEQVSREVNPKNRDESMHYSVLTHEYIRKEVYRTPDLMNSYGKRTNWGEKVYVKTDPNSYLVLNIPTGQYVDLEGHPNDKDLIGLKRILKTLPDIISHRYTGALFPIELANGIASMSSYPSSSILQKFLEENMS
ncbi:hypothetical protein SAMN04488072_10420 [Lentibacillus halodurans]|uniref:NurA domain-containing protein n=1 Tax=Lentibacillus halodurans TaxID=237679 RepID=A0A1I0X067_9BACI|nr:hypothetical protein [Lentibacillus halodurans]SFA93820.1 hypothetical protein SAMN04488072_10420 [Lentibacillus halodurans]